MILCLGTTPTVQRTQLFARLQVDAVNRAHTTHESASGKSINVALVLHALGEHAFATGFLGGDSGQFIEHDLDTQGVKHAFVDTPAKTRTCTTVIDESAGTHTELVEEAKPAGGTAWVQLEHRVAELVPQSRLIVLSGTLAPDGPENFYAHCTRQANAAGARTIVDAKGAPLQLALAEKPFIVKPNRAELAGTFGIDAADDRAVAGAMRQLVELGATWVIITAGHAATLISDGKRFWRMETATLTVLNPIGSGDSFAAGLAAGLHRGQDVPEAAILAGACAGANAMTLLPGHLRIEDVNELAAKISVQEVADLA